MKSLPEILIKPSTSTTTLERDDRDIARVSATLRRIEKHKERLQSEFRDPVSSQFKYVENRIQELESFADRLIRENVAKQAQPDIVARNVRRTNNALAKLIAAQALRAPQNVKTKVYDDVWHASRRYDDIPRTVFGTEAWIDRRVRSYFRKATQPLRFYPLRFVTRSIALPCVERVVRREVLFSTKKAGVGYRVKHRKRRFTDIWC